MICHVKKSCLLLKLRSFGSLVATTAVVVEVMQWWWGDSGRGRGGGGRGGGGRGAVVHIGLKLDEIDAFNSLTEISFP